MAFGNTSGSQTLTANGAVGTSGKPIRVFNATVVSGAAAAAFQLYNNTSKTGTPIISFDGSALRSVTATYEDGLLFPNGCYADLGTASAATIEFRVEK